MHSSQAVLTMLSLLLVLLPISASFALHQTNSDASGGSRCTHDRMQVRREWGVLSLAERKEYIDAVKCLMQQPSEIPPGLATGAISKYDDFTAIHINMTTRIHGDAIFLAWHRHFVYLFHKALVDKCGYRGAPPYWNWPLWAADLASSPIFDGSPTSFSGDGEYIVNAEIPSFGNNTFPRGSGGGCVTTGPFANLTLPFREFPQNLIFNISGILPNNSLDYAPHCFRRDLNTYIATRFTNQTDVDYLIYKSPTIKDFQTVIDGGQTGIGFGAHPGGHYSAGPALFDFFASPSDPAFQLHHGMIDLVWTLWQAQDPKTRQYALSGGDTTFNIPPSPDIDLSYKVSFGYLDRDWVIKDLMDVTKGPYCYRYEY